MNPRTLRHVPWTCEWGRYAVAVEQVGPSRTRVDDVFWACHHPDRGQDIHSVTREECANCPWWRLAGRLRE